MLRFIDTEMVPFLAERGHSTNSILSLEEALKTIIPRVDQLPRFIQIAKDNCHFPSEHNLTHDESAAIFLYTMKWDDDRFYRQMKEDLRSEVPSTSQSWLPYLLLFDTAIQKLPSIRLDVWRGIHEDKCRSLKKDDEFIWWNSTSCSSSTNVIRDCLESNTTLCYIEAINGKDISTYSQFPNQNEVILCSGVRLQVVSHAGDQTSSSVLNLRASDRPMKDISARWNNKQLFSLIPHLIVLLIALLLVVVVGKKLTTSNQTTMMEKPSTSHTHVDELGNRYEGEWLDGKKHGKGTRYFVNGCTYIGDWVDDMATGEAIFTWPHGDRYEGQFRNGQRHGTGSYYFVNGNKYIGGWIEDKMAGYGVSTLGEERYEGEFEDNKMHGTGSFHFVDGSKYIGHWVDNKQEGEGIQHWANGDRYEGEFKAGKLHGQGSYYFANGNKFTGEWTDGERGADHGSFTWADISRHSKKRKNYDADMDTPTVPEPPE